MGSPSRWFRPRTGPRWSFSKGLEKGQMRGGIWLGSSALQARPSSLLAMVSSRQETLRETVT